MAIDPSISLGVRPAQFSSPLEGYGQVLRLKELIARGRGEEQLNQLRQQEIQAQQLKNQETQRAQAEAEDWRGIFNEAGGDLKKARELAVSRSMSPQLIMKLDSGITSQVKLRAEQDEATRKALREKNALLHDAVYAVSKAPEDQRPAVWNQRQQEFLNSGVISPQEASPYPGPQGLQQALYAVTSAKQLDDMAEEERKKAKEQRDAEAAAQALINAKTEGQQKALTLAGTGPTGITAEQQAQLDAAAARETAAEADRAANRAVTIRGQNMTDLRQRDLNEINRENKPPTAAQSTAATYAARLKQSNDILDSIVQGARERTWNKIVPDFASFLRTDKGQRFDQAQRDFINATLRRESGAVINKDEFKNAAQQYLPQPGDSEATLRQKKNNRTIVMESFKRAAGKAYVDPQELLGGGKGNDPLGIR